MSTRVRTGFGAALLVAALVQTGPPPAAGAPGPTGPAAAGPVHRVTLITGDVVSYHQTPGTVRVDPAPRADGAAPAFGTVTTREGVFVYPSDAMPLVSGGELDHSLFNVTALVADGRQDDATDRIPLIAEPDGRQALSASLAVRAVLPGAGAVAVGVDKARAPEFWQSLTAGRLGLSKISLDRKVKVQLDRSTKQVGAPAAWERGLDGRGVKVAVVDTGVDARHPDLAGRVAAAEDFSGDGDATDHNGHGTHVASTIAGDGKASGGRYRGVAPAATLLSAKVFGQSGEGDTSQVMAGVEWAVAQGADVVNLSLGAGPTDGMDPLSGLIDRLSAKTGTLFVVAAGNAGPADRSVTTPGAASSALTVGAVDREDHLAWFSSRGPRLRDALAKPEIVAPGVDIVAARAAGTSLGTPVDENYTTSSGTSMATPHVAGAAALLAQQHPDWTGQAIKDVLASTAKDVGAKWYEQGAGRLDVARAVSQRTTGQASASFGKVEGTAPANRNVTYTNGGDAPVSLGLALRVDSWDGAPPPAAAMKLARADVRVPAHSTSTTTVTVDPDEGPPGVYGGTIVATAPDGGTIRTPVSTYNAPPLFPVSLKVLDVSGAPAKQAVAQIIDDSQGVGHRNDPFAGEVATRVDLVDGAGRVSLPAGSYSALGWTMERTLTTRRWTGLSAAEVKVDRATSITLDGRAAVPVGLSTTSRTDQRDRTVVLRRVLPAVPGAPGLITEVGVSAGTTGWDVRVTPSAPARVGAVSLQDQASLGRAAVDLAVAGRAFEPVFDLAAAVAWPGAHRVAVVPADAPDVRDKVALVKVPVPPGVADPVGPVNAAAATAVRNAAAAGAVAAITYVDAPGALPLVPLTGLPIPAFSLGSADAAAVRGDAEITVRPAPDAMFNLNVVDRDGVPADHVRRYAPDQLVATKTSYHADRPGVIGQKTWYAFPDGLWKAQFAQGVRLPFPGSWTEYTGPGDDTVVWKRVATSSATKAALSLTRFSVYRPGERERPEEHWFRAPLHASPVELEPDHPGRRADQGGRWGVLCSQCREGDLFTPALQWVDGGAYVSPHENSKYFATTTARLFRDGQEVQPVTGPYALFPRFPMAPGTAAYRLDVVDVLAGPGFPGAPSTPLLGHARRTETSWSFTSARSSEAPPTGYVCQDGDRCSFQPLIALDYRLPLDVRNTLTGRKFDVAAASHTGARGAGPVVWLRVSWSTDGRTWTDAPTAPTGQGVWTVDAPAVSGDVWLRAEARDSRGNAVRQTVQEAYRSP
ncbi:S8 family serine peptidase [Actinosynnema sp. NPDC050436]|uniref:S8 family peptidase n=1 Tax=Actinosynnema sp. NPDC050436 TaxID=3155659 RepID=UPI0034091C52